MSQQIKHMTRVNAFKNGYGIERKQFTCLEITVPTAGNWYKKVLEKAKIIEKSLNAGKANTSEKRDEKTLQIDNLSGVIAEHACYTLLRDYFKIENIEKPSSDSSKNQIDIALLNGKKTIEVRSSCVKNGIDFALFAKPYSSSKQQYFDVIGPYSNGYKPGELLKDYYMRVLYWCDKRNFMDLVKQPELKLYITGGATKEMLEDENCYQIKHLLPAGGEVKVESDYRVVPLGKSLDIDSFINLIMQDVRTH